MSPNLYPLDLTLAIQHEEAIEYLEKSVQLSPIDKQSWFTLGCSAVAVERWNKAIDAFNRVLSLSPDVGSSLFCV